MKYYLMGEIKSVYMRMSSNQNKDPKNTDRIAPNISSIMSSLSPE
jgi:hypothetical protein